MNDDPDPQLEFNYNYPIFTWQRVMNIIFNL